ncbi:hypothetical protein F4776DRAFT_538713 [Hypoxylon sp. NC0597]|nr:hypothetical protein F4776DRAFT_538713 [Hypoxylon sp. NC0597]
MPRNQQMASYPMTQRLCECGTPLVAWFQTDRSHPFYHLAPPSPRPILFCPACQIRASRPHYTDPPQNSVYQYPTGDSQASYHGWHQGLHDGYHTSYHPGQTQPSSQFHPRQTMPYGSDGYLYQHHPPGITPRNVNFYSDYGPSMAHPQLQTEPRQHQHQHEHQHEHRHQHEHWSHQPSPRPGLASATSQGFPELIPPEPTGTPNYVASSLPFRPSYANQSISSPSQHRLYTEPPLEHLREATTTFEGIQDPSFWVAERAERSHSPPGNSRRSSSSSSSVVEISPPPPKARENRERTEDTEGGNNEFPPLAFAESGEILLLDSRFSVPSREEAINESGPTTGFSRVTSLHESVDERGRPTTVQITEDLHNSDWTMSGGLPQEL